MSDDWEPGIGSAQIKRDSAMADRGGAASLDEHVHSWMPVGIVDEDQTSYSPVSRFDHEVRTNKIAVQSCSCGETRRVLVSWGTWRWLNR